MLLPFAPGLRRSGLLHMVIRIAASRALVTAPGSLGLHSGIQLWRRLARAKQWGRNPGKSHTTFGERRWRTHAVTCTTAPTQGTPKIHPTSGPVRVFFVIVR